MCAVTGSGDLGFGRLLASPLTTIVMPYAKTIHAALARIIDRIEHPEKAFDRMERYIPADVVFRRSSLLGG